MYHYLFNTKSFPSQTNMGFEFWIFEPSGGLLFPTVDYLREVVLSKLYEETNKNKVLHGGAHTLGDVFIIINCAHIDQTDYTAAQVRHYTGCPETGAVY